MSGSHRSSTNSSGPGSAAHGVHAGEDLLRAERLATLGRLSARVSGELRQPLSVIRNAVYFLNNRLSTSEDAKVRRYMSIMLRELNVATALVNNLTQLASVRIPERTDIDVDIIVPAALDCVACPANVSIRTAVDPSARLYADPSLLKLALANVITNSIQAMPEGGRIRVVCRRNTDETVIEVTDDGCGMPDYVAERVLEPMFTTSEHRLGIGMTVVERLVGANGGTVEVKSEPGKGTTVRLRFLRHDQAAREAQMEREGQ